MVRFRISTSAGQDLKEILAWTHKQFGEQGRLRYEALLFEALLDLATDPNRPGCTTRPELLRGAVTYHLRYSRDHVPSSTGRVKKPRHFLLGRIAATDCLEIARVLHDSMDLPQHLPPEYSASSTGTD